MLESNSLDKVGDDMEEMYSIGSVSPCLCEPEAVSRAGETTVTKLPACHSQENNFPLHISPLEAIRELDEAEEALSGLRSPGDGAVRAKDQLGTKESPVHCAEQESDELALEDCEEDDAPRPVLKTLRAIMTSEDRINLETPQTETCSSPHDVSDLVCLGEDSLKCETLLESGVHKGLLGTNSSLERTIVIIGSEVNDAGSSVQNLKEKHMNTSTGLSVGSSELRNSTGLIAHLEENPAVDQLQGDVCASRRDCAEVCNSTLIDILTACKSKVEQLEQLKCSSFELTVQLQSAQGLAAHLQQQVLALEQERCRRQREVQGLQEQLQEAQWALQERSSQAARVSEELRLLHMQLKKRPSASGSSEVQEASNGHTCPPTTGPDHGPSRVCILL